MSDHFEDTGFVPRAIAILTVSDDARGEAEDASGRLLQDRRRARHARTVVALAEGVGFLPPVTVG